MVAVLIANCQNFAAVAAGFAADHSPRSPSRTSGCLRDPVAFDVEVSGEAQPFLVLGMLSDALARIGHRQPHGRVVTSEVSRKGSPPPEGRGKGENVDPQSARKLVLAGLLAARESQRPQPFGQASLRALVDGMLPTWARIKLQPTRHG